MGVGMGRGGVEGAESLDEDEMKSRAVACCGYCTISQVNITLSFFKFVIPE